MISVSLATSQPFWNETVNGTKALVWTDHHGLRPSWVSVPAPAHLLYVTLASYSTSLGLSFLICRVEIMKASIAQASCENYVRKVLSMTLVHRIKSNDPLLTALIMSTFYLLANESFLKEIDVSLTQQISLIGHLGLENISGNCSTLFWPPQFCNPKPSGPFLLSTAVSSLGSISLSAILLSSHHLLHLDHFLIFRLGSLVHLCIHNTEWSFKYMLDHVTPI